VTFLWYDVTMTEPERLWTAQDLAREAGVNDAYIRRLCLDGKIRGEKLGRQWLIRDADARRWLEIRAMKKALSL